MGPVAPIYIGTDAIEWVNKSRLLGITVDDKLSESHRKSQTAVEKLQRFFCNRKWSCTVKDDHIRSTVFKQNVISLIRSYGHFVTSSRKRKRNNEASDELLGEAEAALG